MKNSNHNEKTALITTNSIVGMTANGFYLVSRLAITPFILHYVPLNQYGLWSLCFVILSYAGLSGFGINNAYIKYVAQYHAAGDYLRLNTLICTGLFIMCSICLVIFLGLYMTVPFFIAKFQVDPALQGLSRTLILGTAAIFLIDMGLGAFKAMLEGLQEIAMVRIIWLASTLLEVILICLLLYADFGVLSLLYALIVRYIVGLVCFIFMAKKRLKELQLRLVHVTRDAAAILLSYGSKVQILGFIGIFMTSFDRIVTTAIVGLEGTGRFEIGRKLPSLGASVSAASFDAFLPAASASGSWLQKEREPSLSDKMGKYGNLALLSLIASSVLVIPLVLVNRNKFPFLEHDFLVPGLIIVTVFLFWLGTIINSSLRYYFQEDEYVVGGEMISLYLSGSRYINLINGILLLFLLAASQSILYAWVGEGYSSSVWVMRIISFSVLINLATGPGTALIKGMNRPGREFEYALVNLVLALVWIPALAYLFGMIGAAAGTAISTITASIFFIIRTNSVFRINGADYLREAISPLVAPLIAAVLVGVGFHIIPLNSRWEVLTAVITGGLIYLTICWLILSRFIFSDEEKNASVHYWQNTLVRIGLK